MKKILIFAFSLSFILPSIVFAHPGRTDSAGCHTCRTNCTSWGLSSGEYHCHRSKGIEQPLEPVRSIKAEHITVPAPEYKQPKIKPVESKVPLVKVATSSPLVKQSQVKIIPQTTPKRGLFSWFVGIFR